MNLRAKTIFIVTGTMVVLITVLLALAWHILLGLARIEADEAAVQADRVRIALLNELDDLGSRVRDYASWDDIWHFAGDRNPEFPHTNFKPETLANLRIGLLAIIAPDDEIIFATQCDPVEGKLLPPPADLAATLKNHQAGRRLLNGVLLLGNQNWLTVSQPIQTSAGTDQGRGTLLMARGLERVDLERIGQNLRIPFTASRIVDAESAALARELTAQPAPLIRAGNLDNLSAYTFLADVDQRPAVLLRVDLPRKIYKEGLVSLYYFAVLLLVAGVTFGLLTMLVLERLVLSRLAHLSRSVRQIALSGDPAQRVNLSGHDELWTLSCEINRMLATLERAQQQLRQGENNYRAIVEDQTELICRCHPDGRLVFVNEACGRYFGLDCDKLLGGQIAQIIPENQQESTRDLLAGLRPDQPTVGCERWFHRPSGEVTWLQWTLRAMYDNAGRLKQYQAVGRDISERKLLERENQDISERERNSLGRDLHDGLGQQLTGLAFMSKVLEQKLKSRDLPEAATAADMVKLLNDAVSQTRRLARGLFIESLKASGLATALDELAVTTENLYGIKCRSECALDNDLFGSELAIQLYRIAQEAVTNAAKHAQAKSICLNLRLAGGVGTLRIQDDGVGIAGIRQTSRHQGLGLRSMRYRASLIGASLEVKPGEAKGTTVVCMFRCASGQFSAVLARPGRPEAEKA